MSQLLNRSHSQCSYFSNSNISWPTVLLASAGRQSHNNVSKSNLEQLVVYFASAVSSSN